MKNLFLLVIAFIITLHINAQENIITFLEKTFPEIPDTNNTWDCFGVNVDIDGDYAVVSAQNGHSVYVLSYNGTNWEKVAKLTSSVSGLKNFGEDVAISGDVIVVSTYGYGNDATEQQVYLFEKPDGGWIDMTETAILTAENCKENAMFGEYVDISNDVIIVSAAWNYPKPLMFLFEKPIGGWANMTETAVLEVSDPDINDLGISACIHNDVVVAGSNAKYVNGKYAHQVFVFEKPAGGWEDMNETAILHGDSTDSWESFGNKIDVADEYIIIGYTGGNGKVDNSGVVYLYEKPAGGWADTWECIDLMASDGDESDAFGYSLFCHEDTIIVTARAADGAQGTSNPGAVYLFEKPTDGWADTVEVAKFMAKDGGVYFGYSIAMNNQSIIAGAWGDNTNGNLSGSVYTFYRPSTGWENDTTETKIYPDPYLNFTLHNYGASISIDSNLAVVGTPGFNQNSGCAYILERVGNVWDTIGQLTPSDGEIGDEFGTAVVIKGDIIAVSAPYSDDGMMHYGAIYLFERPINGWHSINETAILTKSSTIRNAQFGSVITLYDSLLIVGAHEDSPLPSIKTGAVYVFKQPSAGWIDMDETAILTASDGAYNDCFGKSLAINDHIIAVGSDKDHDGSTSDGVVYIFEKPVAGWQSMTESYTIDGTDLSYCRSFGSALEINDDNLFIGAPRDNSESYGAVYIYEKNDANWNSVTRIAKLIASDVDRYAHLGSSVALYDDIIIAGSPDHRNNDPYTWKDYGATYVFKKPESGWQYSAEDFIIKADDMQEDDYFGYSLDIFENNILIAAKCDDGGSVSGAVYAYNYNMSPTELVLSSSVIEENAPVGTKGGVFSTLDVDPLDEHTYSLVVGDGTNDQDNDKFYIDGDTLKVNSNINFETNDELFIYVQVSDGVTDPYEKAFVITVLDIIEEPTDITLSSNIVPENSVAGTVVGTLAGIDDEVGDNFTFSLVAGDGTNDKDNSKFSISGDELKTNAVFNCEENDSLYIHMDANDGNSGSVTKPFIIVVGNVNEAPSQIALSHNEIDDNAAIGSEVGTFSTTDEDITDTYTYALVSGDGSNDADNSKFTISGDKLITNAAYDHSVAEQLYIYVESMDAGELTVKHAFVIQVNDVTGVDPLDAMNDGWLVYPNPSKGVVNISIKENMIDESIIEIFNSSGKLVSVYEVNQNQLSIDLSDQPKGSYIVRLKSGEQAKLKNIVIE